MGLVAIFGAGVMGETLLSGLLRAGRSADDLVVTERRPDRAAELSEKYGVKVLSNIEAADLAETLVFVVKPQDMGALCDEISGHVQRDNLVVSLAAGIIPASVTVTPEAGNFRWQYSIVLPTDMKLQAGDYFTIYDFAGLVDGSVVRADRRSGVTSRLCDQGSFVQA